jgi:hypothetical protein
MNTEEKIYSLMAQAEDMQAHAEKLQNGAEKTFAGLPLAVEQAGQKIRSTTLLGALFVLAVGLVVSSVAVAGVWWGTSRLRDEAIELRGTIATLRQYVADERKTLQDLEKKTWRIELVDYGKEGRGIILPKGVKIDRTGNIPDGRIAVVIKP